MAGYVLNAKEKEQKQRSKMKMKYHIWNKKDVLLAEFNSRTKADNSLKALCDYFPDNTLTCDWD